MRRGQRLRKADGHDPSVPQPSSSPYPPPAPSLEFQAGQSLTFFLPLASTQQCLSLRELARAPHVLSTAVPAQVPHLELLHPGAVPIGEPSHLTKKLSLWDALQGLGGVHQGPHQAPAAPPQRGWGSVPTPAGSGLWLLQWGTLWTEEGPQVQASFRLLTPRLLQQGCSAPQARQHHSDSKTPPCPQESRPRRAGR